MIEVDDEMLITVTRVPGVGPEEEARLHLLGAAEALKRQAASAHARGMTLLEQSAKIAQIADLLEDASVVAVRDLFVEAGLLAIEDEEPEPVVTARGGEG